MMRLACAVRPPLRLLDRMARRTVLIYADFSQSSLQQRSDERECRGHASATFMSHFTEIRKESTTRHLSLHSREYYRMLSLDIDDFASLSVLRRKSGHIVAGHVIEYNARHRHQLPQYRSRHFSLTPRKFSRPLRSSRISSHLNSSITFTLLMTDVEL